MTHTYDYDYCDLCKQYDYISDMWKCPQCCALFCSQCKYVDNKIECYFCNMKSETDDE